MVSPVSDLVSIVVLFYKLARWAELPSHVHFEWRWCRGSRLFVQHALPLGFLEIFMAFPTITRPVQMRVVGNIYRIA